MKKILTKMLFIFILATVTIPTITACRSKTNTTFPPASTSLTTQTANEQPVEVVSVTGPLQPVNPGGPAVEVSLKNIAAMPIVTLTAVFKSLGAGNYSFVFDVSDSNPLLPGASISDAHILIGAGFSDNISYPLYINGAFQNGATFSYVVQVQIAKPSN